MSDSTLTSNRFWLKPFLTAVLLVFCIDCLIFRSGLYEKYIKFDSSAGIYLYRSGLLSKYNKGSNNIVAVMGDSRIGEGFSAKIFDQQAENSNYSALNFAVPGSTPRVWYYLLRRIDPSHKAFEMVVIPMCSYSDHDEAENFVDRSLDLQFLMPFLPVSDCLDCLSTYSDPTTRIEAFLDSILKMYALKLDIRDFVLNPVKRIKDLEISSRYNDYGYSGNDGSIEQVLEKTKTPNLLNSKDIALIDRLNKRVSQAIPTQSGFQRRYNRFWLNRIVNMYKNTNTIVMFVRIPAYPLPRAVKVPHDCLTMDSLSQNSKVIVEPENTFANLERSSLFFDELHMNSFGRKMFSEKLSDLILESLKKKTSLAETTSVCRTK